MPVPVSEEKSVITGSSEVTVQVVQVHVEKATIDEEDVRSPKIVPLDTA